MHHIVILGGGFGGLYAARALKRARAKVTVLDRRNFHLFQPLLYQVATGALSPGDIASPLRTILSRQKNTHVLMGEAIDIDVENRHVILTNGEVEYDTLIISTGSTHHYFGNSEWSAIAPGLKTIEDATEIRRRIVLAFEAAEVEPDPEKKTAWLTFVVVGGGPTGVELAGTLGEIANDALRNDFRSIRPEESRIMLLDAAPRVLPTYPPELSAKAEYQLLRLGVRARTGVAVVKVTADGVDIRTQNGIDHIPARTVLWAAGVAASPMGRVLAERTGCLLDRAGRVIVNPDCSVPGQPDIFVIGDLAHFEQDGVVVPGVAPAAMQQGRYLARLLRARIDGKPAPPPFRYHDKGSMATIGRAAAVAHFGRIRFNGFLAWLTWLFVHLMYLVGFENRVVVFLKWAFLYITFNRNALLITGEFPPLPPISVRQRLERERVKQP